MNVLTRTPGQEAIQGWIQMVDGRLTPIYGLISSQNGYHPWSTPPLYTQRDNRVQKIENVLLTLVNEIVDLTAQVQTLHSDILRCIHDGGTWTSTTRSAHAHVRTNDTRGKFISVTSPSILESDNQTTTGGRRFSFRVDGGSVSHLFSVSNPGQKEENELKADNGNLQVDQDSTVSSFAFGQGEDFSFTGISPTKKSQKCRTIKECDDDHIYFTPVVKLPDNVEIKTGEEDEDLVFCHRGKLYRFTQNEWKERGIGNVKILRNKATQKVRILMRREQVLKLCMNHAITKDLALNPMPNVKGKAWVWHADDFAEEERSHEQFAIRFGTEEAANTFKNMFEMAQTNPSAMTALEPVLEMSPEKKSKPRSDSYRRKSESKDTEEKDEKTEIKSDAFSTFSLKSPEAQKASASDVPKPKNTGFNFSSAANFGESKPVFGSGSSSASSVFKSLTSSEGDGALGLSKSPVVSSSDSDVIILKEEPVHKDRVQAANSTSGSTPSLFEGSSFSSSSFGDLASLARNKSEGFAFGKSESFSWDGAGKSVFESATKSQQREEDGDDDEVSESPDVHFEPIVQLPEVVDLKTGEEEDEKIFWNRAKLFRYTDGQWMERGIGEMKILKNRETGRVRLLMRREQVLKVACNHYLTPEMALKPLQTSETAWWWYAVDHAENQPKDEQFAVKFKTKEQATLFKEKFDECRDDLAEKGHQNLLEEDTESSTDGNTGVDITVLFSERATLFYLEEGAPKQVGMGELQVVYDDDVCGGRVQMKTDKEQLICNHIVCRKYVLHQNEKKKMCEWMAEDFSTEEPIRRHFRAQFKSAYAVWNFNEVFQQGLTWAKESEIDEVTGGASVTGELTIPHMASSI